MRKIYYLLGLLSFIFIVSCSKNNTCGFKESSATATDDEKTSLADSIAKYGITGTLQHPAGFYYKIENPGTGDIKATLCSGIVCTYWGGFFSGTGFDSTTTDPIKFQLGQMIPGWQKGIPLIKAGGKMTLYIPPSLGYGSKTVPNPQGATLIPANSFLVFKVSVVDIQ